MPVHHRPHALAFGSYAAALVPRWVRRMVTSAHAPPDAAPTTASLRRMAQLASATVQRCGGAHKVALNADQMAEFDRLLSDVDGDVLGVGPRRFSTLHPRETACCDVYSSKDVTMMVFVLGGQAELPLHDHPDMYVFTKVLWGTLSVDSYDVCDGHVKQNERQLVDAGNTLSLTPTEANLHRFAPGGKEGVAFLDILVPPYDFDNGRHCTYWTLREDGMMVGGDAPDSLIMHNYAYNGPRLDK